MRITILAALAIGGLLIPGLATAAVISQTANDPSGTTITTTVDTGAHTVRFDFDFTSLPYSYSQVEFKMPGFPLLGALDGVVSPYASGYTTAIVLPDGTLDIRLQAEYETAADPPSVNYIEFGYQPEFQFTGLYFPAAGDEPNSTVTYREPAGGFPDGQESEIKLSAYTPQASTVVPAPPSMWLMLGGLAVVWGLRRRYTRSRGMRSSQLLLKTRVSPS